MLSVTHRHVFVINKKCADTRLVVCEHDFGCIQTRPVMRKFACGHVHVSQKVAQRDVFFTVNTVLQISKTNVLRHVFVCQSWIQRRVSKLKSSGGTSFRLQMWVVR